MADELETAQHLAFTRLLIHLSTRMIDAEQVEADACIDEALSELGKFAGADRAYVFTLRPGGYTADNTHEWCSDPKLSQKALLQGIEVDQALPWFFAHMRRLEVVHVPDVLALPPEAHAERADFARQSIRSLLVVPLVSKGVLCGFLGFDSVRERRTWRSDDVTLLKIAGQLLIGVLERNRVERERAELEAGMREWQRLESLGVLAGGVAHDFNNLLTAVLGQASLARAALGPGHPAWSNIELIEEAARRAAELTRQLLAFSGRGTFVRARMDLSAAVREVSSLLEASMPRKGSVRWRFSDKPVEVEGDASQMRQVTMNLLLNACEAVSDASDAAVTVTTGVTKLDRSALTASFFPPGTNADEVAFIEVSDNGPGIPAEHREKLFEPFFSTKARGRGLGLAAVLGVVRGQHGGIQVESGPDSGTRVRVLLPLAAGAARAPHDATPARSEAPARAGRVLVIDDDDLVRHVACSMLEQSGLQVVEASDGEHGLEAFGRDPEAIDLVVLDMTMPGLDGPEVAMRLRSIEPEVRVLMVSGYPPEDTARRVGKARADGFLQKPFSIEELSEAVTKTMRASGGHGNHS